MSLPVTTFANASFGSVTIQNEPVSNSDAVTVAYLQAKIDALVANAPGALDTLNEIALALNNDPNLYTTLSGMITTASGAVTAEAARATAAEDALAIRVATNEADVTSLQIDKLNVSESGSVNIPEYCYIGEHWRLAGIGSSLEFQYSNDGANWTVGIPFVSV